MENNGSEPMAVIVVIFPEPKGVIETGIIIAKAKLPFQDMPQVTIKMGVGESAQKIISYIEAGKEDQEEEFES